MGNDLTIRKEVVEGWRLLSGKQPYNEDKISVRPGNWTDLQFEWKGARAQVLQQARTKLIRHCKRLQYSYLQLLTYAL